MGHYKQWGGNLVRNSILGGKIVICRIINLRYKGTPKSASNSISSTIAVCKNDE
jgi:hypothetical protein